jgi:hypothetical protein
VQAHALPQASAGLSLAPQVDEQDCAPQVTPALLHAWAADEHETSQGPLPQVSAASLHAWLPSHFRVHA